MLDNLRVLPIAYWLIAIGFILASPALLLRALYWLRSNFQVDEITPFALPFIKFKRKPTLAAGRGFTEAASVSTPPQPAFHEPGPALLPPHPVLETGDILSIKPVFKIKWGSRGSDNGQFADPYGIDTDKEGNVYIADSGNHRVQVFDSYGHFLTKWGDQGTGEGQFQYPKAIEVDSAGGLVYVADTGNCRIQLLDMNGNFKRQIGGAYSQPFKQPMGLALDKIGNLYVADASDQLILVFDRNGTLVKRWDNNGEGHGRLRLPFAVAVNNTREWIYVVDNQPGGAEVQKYNLHGTYLGQIGNGNGSGRGEFSTPRDIALDIEEYIYVAELNNHRIQVFDPAGQLVTTWGRNGNSEGEFERPAGIALDSQRNIYVVENGLPRGGREPRIQKFGLYH